MNIIITGASRGIGRALTEHFTCTGDNNVIGISRNREKLNEMKKKLMKNNFFPVPFDLTDLSRENSLVEEVKEIFDTVDILINNAGHLNMSPFEEITPGSVETSVTVNFIAPALLIKGLLPLMGTKARGHVLNISSMGGYQGSVKFPGLTIYSATKGALTILTECLAEEYKDRNISFNCLALGAVQTEMLEEAFPGYKAPLNASEMAGFIADFATSGMKFFNGKILPVSVSTP